MGLWRELAERGRQGLKAPALMRLGRELAEVQQRWRSRLQTRRRDWLRSLHLATREEVDELRRAVARLERERYHSQPPTNNGSDTSHGTAQGGS